MWGIYTRAQIIWHPTAVGCTAAAAVKGRGEDVRTAVLDLKLPAAKVQHS